MSVGLVGSVIPQAVAAAAAAYSNRRKNVCRDH